jgi:putative hemolysin
MRSSAPAPVVRPDARGGEVFPHHADAIPPGTVEAGAYAMRFAWTRADLHAVQALRFRVFNEELGEGLAESAATGRDEDPRDAYFHHLMIVHRASGEVVGTYRMQTAVMAASRFGFYSATLFELGGVPGRILADAVEVGRACVAPAHRTGRVIRLLWKGLARYLRHNAKGHLFGCCSLPGTDPDTALAGWRAVHARGALHAGVLVAPRPEVHGLPDGGRSRPAPDTPDEAPTLPPLFDSYLTLGARVCGAPAVDREFGTTDFLVLLDIAQMPAHMHQAFFG